VTRIERPLRFELDWKTERHSNRVESLWPPGLDPCPPSAASFRIFPSRCLYSSEHANLTSFAGRKVIVIGAGQSAFESAALLHELARG